MKIFSISISIQVLKKQIKNQNSAKDKIILVMHVKTYLILFFSYSRIK